MDITESGFQTPAKRERPRDHLLSHLLANPPCRPQTTKKKIPLIAAGIDPKFNTPIKIMSELRQYHPNLRVFQIKQTKKWLDFHRRYSQRLRHPAERAKNAARFREKS